MQMEEAISLRDAGYQLPLNSDLGLRPVKVWGFYLRSQIKLGRRDCKGRLTEEHAVQALLLDFRALVQKAGSAGYLSMPKFPLEPSAVPRPRRDV